MIRRLPLFLALGCSSCGYELGNLYEIRDVRVETFENVSERRTQEFDLTDSIIHEMTARGIRVNAKDAAYTLKGRILDIRTPSVVDQKLTDQAKKEKKAAELKSFIARFTGIGFVSQKSVWKSGSIR